MTIKQYLHDDKTVGIVTVTDIVGDKDSPAVRLAETWFHAQGGGQRADRGVIGFAQVIHVAHNGNDVDHYVADLAGIEAGMQYPFQVDAAWRTLNATYHTAGHLIANVVERQWPGLRAVAGHQWPGEARVEFEGVDIVQSDAQARLDEALQTVIAQDLPVVVLGNPFHNRSIQIGDYPAIPCGGTHATKLSQLGRIAVASVKRKNGRIRVSYSLSSADVSPSVNLRGNSMSQ